MEYDEIRYTVQDRVATITLHRPERLNAWTPVMESELRHAVAAATADDDVRALVITGSGRAFCAGMDMARLAAGAKGAPPAAAPPSEPARPVADAASDDDDLNQRYSYLLAVPKPLIIGINGAIAGVAACVALYGDLRWMAEGAKLTFPYSRRGLVAEHGSAWMLPRLVGPMHAADLLLSGRTVSAAEAEGMGLVKRLPSEGFHQAVHTYAAELASACSPRSMRIIKRQLQAAWRQSLAAATELADREVAGCRGTEDFAEGVAHFLEKRAPQFTGR